MGGCEITLRRSADTHMDTHKTDTQAPCILTHYFLGDGETETRVKHAHTRAHTNKHICTHARTHTAIGQSASRLCDVQNSQGVVSVFQKRHTEKENIRKTGNTKWLNSVSKHIGAVSCSCS